VPHGSPIVTPPVTVPMIVPSPAKFTSRGGVPSRALNPRIRASLVDSHPRPSAWCAYGGICIRQNTRKRGDQLRHPAGSAAVSGSVRSVSRSHAWPIVSTPQNPTTRRNEHADSFDAETRPDHIPALQPESRKGRLSRSKYSEFSWMILRFLADAGTIPVAPTTARPIANPLMRKAGGPLVGWVRPISGYAGGLHPPDALQATRQAGLFGASSRALGSAIHQAV
jgi:hypothetical protein